jgi:hypothetical protein
MTLQQLRAFLVERRDAASKVMTKGGTDTEYYLGRRNTYIEVIEILDGAERMEATGHHFADEMTEVTS